MKNNKKLLFHSPDMLVARLRKLNVPSRHITRVNDSDNRMKNKEKPLFHSPNVLTVRDE